MSYKKPTICFQTLTVYKQEIPIFLDSSKLFIAICAYKSSFFYCIFAPNSQNRVWSKETQSWGNNKFFFINFALNCLKMLTFVSEGGGGLFGQSLPFFLESVYFAPINHSFDRRAKQRKAICLRLET